VFALEKDAEMANEQSHRLTSTSVRSLYTGASPRLIPRSSKTTAAFFDSSSAVSVKDETKNENETHAVSKEHGKFNRHRILRRGM
jgi:hypothetical protein